MPLNAFDKTNYNNLLPNLEPKQTADSEKLQAALQDMVNQFDAIRNILIGTAAGDSGAHNIGSDAISGVTGATVYAQLANLKAQIDQIVASGVADGSIAEIKLAQAVQTKLNQLATTVIAGKILLGHGNGADVDKLDGKHYNDIEMDDERGANIWSTSTGTSASATAGLIHSVVLNTGLTRRRYVLKNITTNMYTGASQTAYCKVSYQVGAGAEIFLPEHSTTSTDTNGVNFTDSFPVDADSLDSQGQLTVRVYGRVATAGTPSAVVKVASLYADKFIRVFK